MKIQQGQASKLQAESANEWGRVKQGNFTALFKGMRYVVSCNRYGSRLGYFPIGRGIDSSFFGHSLDLLQAIHNTSLGYLNLHIKDLRSIKISELSLGRVTKSLKNVSLCKVGHELLNVMDIACFARAGLWGVRVIGDQVNKRFMGNNLSDKWRICQLPDLVLSRTTSAYKIVKMFLSVRAAISLCRDNADPMQKTLQILDAGVRIIDATKIVIDTCDSYGIPASQVITDALSSMGCPVIGSVSTSLGFIGAFSALLVSMTALCTSNALLNHDRYIRLN